MDGKRAKNCIWIKQMAVFLNKAAVFFAAREWGRGYVFVPDREDNYGESG